MIRIATEEDVGEILALYAPYILTTTATFEYDVPSAGEFLRRFQSITQMFPWLVWEEDGEILGYTYASYPYHRAAYSWCAEPSVYVRRDARGKGVGKKLYAALEAVMRYQGFQVFYAMITEENRWSLAFHESCGYEWKVCFDNCGFKFGRWLGLVWMEKRLKPVEIPSSTPIKWSQLSQDRQKISDILDSLSLS